MSTAIQRVPTQPLEFSPDQRKLILDSFLSGASEQEAAVLLELARLRRLNPITNQIHFVKRWNSQRRCETWSAQVGIDGFRSIAERTGLYDGQDEPEFEYDPKGQLRLCRVRIYRKDWSRPAVGVAHLSEYVQRNKEGQPNAMWGGKPHVMLAKCAEALAFRKAFPDDTSGLYAPEEMGGEERDITPQAPSEPVPALTEGQGKRTAEVKARIAAKVRSKAVPINPWERIQEIAERYGIPRDSDRLKSVVKGATSKTNAQQLTPDDIAKVEATLITLTAAGAPPGGQEPPPPTDADFVPQGEEQ